MGKLICLEGIDSAGKGTQSKLIQEYLQSKNLKFASYHFPMYGHNEFSEIIARFLRGEFGGINEISPYFVANIYAMDRFMFLPELQKALKENNIVLLDRYVFSNLAYQGAKYPIESIKSAKIKQWILDFEFEFLKLPYPDFNIFFDVPIEVIKKRMEIQREGSDKNYLQGKQDIHEVDLEFQKRVRDNYLGIMEGDNCYIVRCAIQLGNPPTWSIFSPEDLFKTYKFVIDSYLEYK